MYARTEAFVRGQMSDARSFSLDSPKSHAPRIEAIRKLDRWPETLLSLARFEQEIPLKRKNRGIVLKKFVFCENREHTDLTRRKRCPQSENKEE